MVCRQTSSIFARSWRKQRHGMRDFAPQRSYNIVCEYSTSSLPTCKSIFAIFEPEAPCFKACCATGNQLHTSDDQVNLPYRDLVTLRPTASSAFACLRARRFADHLPLRAAAIAKRLDGSRKMPAGPAGLQQRQYMQLLREGATYALLRNEIVLFRLSPQFVNESGWMAR